MSTSPTTTCAPSVTITPSTVRALWVARRPHQHSASTCRTWTRSASSISRWDPGKQPGAEVRADAKGKHVDVDLVHNAGQLLHLRRRVELGFITDQVVHAEAAGPAPDHLVPEVGGVQDLHAVRLQPEAAGDPGTAGAVVAAEPDTAAAPGPVVVVHLQGEGGFSAVHGA